MFKIFLVAALCVAAFAKHDFNGGLDHLEHVGKKSQKKTEAKVNLNGLHAQSFSGSKEPLGGNPPATGFEYLQSVVFDDTDCTGNIFAGFARLLDKCFLYSYENMEAMTEPIYVKYKLQSNNTLSVMTWNNSDCTGKANLISPNIAKVGCFSNSVNNGVRSVETLTPLWPQGIDGASIKIHSTMDQCKVDNGYAYNFHYDTYAPKGSCINVTTTSPYAAKSMKITSCSSSGNTYTVDFYEAPGCTGTPSTETFGSNDRCDAPVYINGLFGYASLSCYDGAQHNKCYEMFGISSPTCDATLTSSALKFTCPDKSYNGCASRLIEMSSSQFDAQVVACCI